MRKLLIAFFLTILPLLIPAKTNKEYDKAIPVYHLHDKFRDTIDFRNRLLRNERKFIVYCAQWCKPSYREFNLLYSQGIIDKLKEDDFHLIVIADKSPCLNLHDPLIEGNWSDTFLQDFEIYYQVNQSFLKELTGESSFPYILLMNNSEILIESRGLKSDYSFITDCINKLTDD